MNKLYDKKVVAKYLAMAIGVILAWYVTGGAGALLVSVFVIVAALQRKSITLMFWVLFMTYTTAGNSQLLVKTVLSSITIRATLVLLTGMLAAQLVSGGRETRLLTPFWGIMFYIGWECVVSMQGFSPIVSYLKLFLFFCIFLSMIAVANTVNRSTRTNATLLRSAILAIISLVVIGSALLIPFPSLSLMSSKADIERMLAGEVVSLFQGMTSHSQVLGPVMAVLGTFVFADLAFSIKRWDKFYVLLAVLCPYLIYRSSSRTGMGTYIAGCAMVVMLIMKAKGIGRGWKGKLITTINVLVILGAIATCAIPSVRERVAGFALKYTSKSGAAVSMESMISTRQALIDESVRNFKNKPIQGNGFQVSEAMLHDKRSGIASYLSAPIEKGVWIYAVSEEGGVIGMMLFTGWLIVLFTLLIKRHAYIGASVFFAVLMTNFGEFSIFAMSYVGGFYWTLTFAAICLDVQRMKAAAMPVFFVPIIQVREEVGADEWGRVQG